MENRYIDVDNIGWVREMEKSYETYNSKDGNEFSTSKNTDVDKCENKRERYILGIIERDVEPFIKKILKKYDFSEDIDKTCLMASVKLRKVLMAYFGKADYKKYVAIARVYSTENGDVGVELGYSKEIWKSKNSDKWSLDKAKREFNVKD